MAKKSAPTGAHSLKTWAKVDADQAALEYKEKMIIR